MLCILYVNVVGLLVSLVAVLTERLWPATYSRRWIWCVALLTSIAVPAYYRSHHVMAVGHGPGLDATLLGQLGSIDMLIDAAWALTTVSLFGWVLVNAGWIAHLVRVSRARLRGVTPSALGGVPVVITDGMGPATVGVLRPRILLPRWVLALPDVQRQYIVQHEEEHRRSRDATLLFVAALPAILLPWSAPLWWQLRRLHLAVEMDCDQRVVATLGNAQAYGTLLLSVAQACSRGPRMQPALLGRRGMLERRLTALLAPSLLPRVQRVLLATLAVVLLSVVLTTPHPVMASHAHDAGTISSRAPLPR